MLNSVTYPIREAVIGAIEDVGKQSTSTEQISDTDNPTILVNDNDKQEDDSIESISFIAEPSKQKRTRSTK